MGLTVRAYAILLAGLASFGCAERTVEDPASMIGRYAAVHGAMPFCSNRGMDYGVDADTIIRFGEGGKVVLVEYGCSVGEYPGTYSTGAEGVISLHLGKYGEWPRMVMTRAGRDYYLHTESGYTGFIMGQRAGACPDNTPWWPFKLLVTP